MYLFIKKVIKSILPQGLYSRLLPFYHLVLVEIAVLWYRNPTKTMHVVGVTGTKGKSSVTEYVNGILEAAGYTTAIASTIRFKIGETSEPNLLKMTMPGRFFLQRFFARARHAQCDWLIVEMTSEGTRQYRHKGISLDALIFTNLSPEHIESHGSYENYVAAKLKIAHALHTSKKRPRVMIANADDEHGAAFLATDVEQSLPYRLTDAMPWSTARDGTTITYCNETIHSPFPGEFTVYNMLAAATFATACGIDVVAIKKGLEATTNILGRVQSIDAGQDFNVVVDYAHTADSLEKLYLAFEGQNKICVLGNTGGGRDTWKRAPMAALAEKYCEHVILTDEDPYDEDPQSIVSQMATGMKTQPTIIMDRRTAIKHALSLARTADVVLITGKGTDPYIMRANGTKEPWSDARVAGEELHILIG